MSRWVQTAASARRPAGLVLLIASLMAAASAASAKVVWLCRPGAHPDPCTPGLSTTIYSPRLAALRVTHPEPVAHPGIDCFYVYPTVSDQTTANADLRIDPEERSIALLQAARYSQYCRVYAPMYRQHTLITLLDAKGLPGIGTGLADVMAAFHTYLTRYNDGRGFVLIGHSQGARVLDQLIIRDVDPRRSVRRRLVSAILLGANVLVKRGRGLGGDFKHIAACRSARQLGCVIAFSTFDQTPPPDSRFGRTKVAGDQVLCTNPAALAGGTANADPVFPSAPFAPHTLLGAAIGALKLGLPRPSTVWISQPAAYHARCETVAGATVLEVAPRRGARAPTPSPDLTWGLHLLDANVALGNLLAVIRSEAVAYAKPARRVN